MIVRRVRNVPIQAVLFLERRILERSFRRGPARGQVMQDILWIAAMLALVLATLAYVRLCDNA
ncbi:hypothetical protein [Sphingomonas immobilis]|uniref:hypothetical protein n=1 Tax=Sphingomonas immobilis TaxID=3063997 RepID=UPI0027298AE5|nr:hypothetical protein [Sphingomonas sp. CA1-15]